MAGSQPPEVPRIPALESCGRGSPFWCSIHWPSDTISLWWNSLYPYNLMCLLRRRLRNAHQAPKALFYIPRLITSSPYPTSVYLPASSQHLPLSPGPPLVLPFLPYLRFHLVLSKTTEFPPSAFTTSTPYTQFSVCASRIRYDASPVTYLPPL